MMRNQLVELSHWLWSDDSEQPESTVYCT